MTEEHDVHDEEEQDDEGSVSDEVVALHQELMAAIKRARGVASSMQAQEGEAHAVGALVLHTIIGEFGSVMQDLCALTGVVAEIAESNELEEELIQSDDAEELHGLLATYKGLLMDSINAGSTEKSEAIEKLLELTDEKLQWIVDHSDWEPSASSESPAA